GLLDDTKLNNIIRDGITYSLELVLASFGFAISIQWHAYWTLSDMFRAFNNFMKILAEIFLLFVFVLPRSDALLRTFASIAAVITTKKNCAAVEDPKPIVTSVHTTKKKRD
ncbi:hypothetical protein ACJX0J_005606, partial [Zea mays]